MDINNLFLNELNQLKLFTGFSKLKFIRNLKNISFVDINDVNISEINNKKIEEKINKISNILKNKKYDILIPILEEKPQENLLSYYLSFIKYKLQQDFKDYYNDIEKINNNFIIEKIATDEVMFFSKLLDKNLTNYFKIEKSNSLVNFSKFKLFNLFFFIFENHKEKYSLNTIKKHFLNLFFGDLTDNIFINEMIKIKAISFNDLVDFYFKKHKSLQEQETIIKDNSLDNFKCFLEETKNELRGKIAFLSFQDLKNELNKQIEKGEMASVSFFNKQIDFFKEIKNGEIELLKTTDGKWMRLFCLLNFYNEIKFPFKINNLKFTQNPYGEIDEKIFDVYLDFLSVYLNNQFNLNSEESLFEFKMLVSKKLNCISLDFLKKYIFKQKDFIIQNINYSLEQKSKKDKIFNVVNFDFIKNNIETIFKNKKMEFINFLTQKNSNLKEKIKEMQFNLFLNNFNYNSVDCYESLFLPNKNIIENLYINKNKNTLSFFEEINFFEKNKIILPLYLSAFITDFNNNTNEFFHKNFLLNYKKEQTTIENYIYKNLNFYFNHNKKFKNKNFNFYKSFEFKTLKSFKDELTDKEFKQYFALFYVEFYLKIKNLIENILYKENIENEIKSKQLLNLFFNKKEIEAFSNIENKNVLLSDGFEKVHSLFYQFFQDDYIEDFFIQNLKFFNKENKKTKNSLNSFYDFFDDLKEIIGFDENNFYNKSFLLKKSFSDYIKKINENDGFQKQINTLEEKLKQQNFKNFHNAATLNDIFKLCILMKLNYIILNIENPKFNLIKEKLNFLKNDPIFIFHVKNINLELFKIGLNLNIDYLYNENSIFHLANEEIIKIFQENIKNNIYYQEIGNKTEKIICSRLENSILILDTKLKKGGGIKSDLVILEDKQYKGISIKSSINNNFHQINLGGFSWSSFINKLKENNIGYVFLEKQLKAFYNPIQAFYDGIIKKEDIDLENKKLILNNNFKILKTFFKKNLIKIFDFYISDKELETKYFMLVDNSNKELNNIDIYLINDIKNFIENNCHIIFEDNIVYLKNKNNNDKIARLSIYGKASGLSNNKNKEDLSFYYNKKENLKLVLYKNIFKYINKTNSLKINHFTNNNFIEVKKYQEILSLNKKLLKQ